MCLRIQKAIAERNEKDKASELSKSGRKSEIKAQLIAEEKPEVVN